MAAPVKIDVADLIDRSEITSFQVGIFILCCASVFMVGFDWQALGYVAPALVQDLEIPSSALGPVFGAANFGFLFGAVLVGMSADRIGRRPVLIGATVFFGVLTLLTARASSREELLVLRFMSGIGFGSVIPTVTALVGEYSPQRKRVTAIMATTTLGLNGGATIGGVVAAWLIPTYGWRSVFYAGAAVPLVVAALMFLRLPESMQFLVLRNRRHADVVDAIRRIDPQAGAGHGVEYVVHEKASRGVPLGHLFREGRARVTLLLWILNFTNLMIGHFLSSWLPTVVREAGYSISGAVLVATVLQVGGVIGTLVLAWLIERRGPIPMLTASLALTCGAVALIGQPGLSPALLTAAVFGAGWCVNGSQHGLNALAATLYVTSLRSSGVGWALGVGRAGAILGPLIGGEFMRRQWPTHQIFLAAAMPAAIATIAMFSMRWAVKGETGPTARTRLGL